MPRVSVFVRGLVPECHEQNGLDDDDSVSFGVEVVEKLLKVSTGFSRYSRRVTYSNSMEEGLACFSTGLEARLFEKIHADVCCPCKQDGLVQQEADLARIAISVVHRAEKFFDIYHRYEWIYVFEEGPEKGALERQVWRRQGSFRP